jgi:hypothetical protein
VSRRQDDLGGDQDTTTVKLTVEIDTYEVGIAISIRLIAADDAGHIVNRVIVGKGHAQVSFIRAMILFYDEIILCVIELYEETSARAGQPDKRSKQEKEAVFHSDRLQSPQETVTKEGSIYEKIPRPSRKKQQRLSAPPDLACFSCWNCSQ